MSKIKNFASIYFVLTSLAGGILHYLFQIIAAKRLEPVAYGELMSWSAYVSIGMALGLLAQTSANFFPTYQSKKESLVLGLITLVCLSASFMTDNLISLAILGIIFSIVYGWINGQYQARQIFATMGTGVVLVGLTKLASLFTGREDLGIYYLGFIIGSAYGALYLLLLSFRLREHKAVLKTHGTLKENALSSILLSLATMLIPQFDLIVSHMTQTPEITGTFARVGLIYRAVFFFILIFAQLILPSQIQNQVREYSPKEKMNLFVALIASLPLALVVAAISPLAIKLVLDFDLSPHRDWIFLTSVHVCLLTLVFLIIQRHAALRDNKTILKFFGVLCGVLAMSFVLKLSMTYYLTLAIIIHTTLIVQHLLRART